MKKTIHKLMYILGTVLLMLGTLMSTGMSVVNAISVQSLSSSAAKVSSTKGSSAKSSLNLANSSSNSVNVQVASSSHSQAVPSQNNSVAKSQSSEMAQSSVENASSASSMSSIAVNTNQRVQPVLASSTDSTASGSGKIGETNIKTLTSASTGALYPHFQTSNGDVVYCYNWDLSTPYQIAGNKYNQYKFFDGLQSVTGNQTKVDEVAAALEAGYHKDADSNTYNVAPQFQNIAEQSYNAIKNDPKVASLNNVQNGQYTLQDFEQDVTQSVIWTLGGATSDTLAGSLPDNYLAENTALGKALLAYAKAHPLDQNTAYPKNVAVKDSNGTVNDSNPLVMDPTTKLSQPFQLSNYNGGVSISNLPKGYEIVDKNGKVVNQVQSGQSYRVKYVGSGNPSNTTANNTVNKIQAKASYEALKDSNYFSAQLTNNSSENNPYQNMVNLTTTENSFDFPIVWSSISSSSSVSSASSKESSESSISSVSSVKSSSSSKKSSSSVKSSSIASSKKATAKSSSVESSKKATTKSSSVVTSKKATAKNSSSANTEKATTSTTEGSSSAKKAVVVGVHNNTNSGKGTGHGQGQGKGEGEGHGMPQTGEAVATSLVVAGVVLLAIAGAITLRKRN